MRFPLHGIDLLAYQLWHALLYMEKIHRYQLKYDDYKRCEHVIQLLGATGVGKTTAARCLWAALHQHVDGFAKACNSHATRLKERILNSANPTRFLMFTMSLQEVGLAEEEIETIWEGKDEGWGRVLAWRQVYMHAQPSVSESPLVPRVLEILSAIRHGFVQPSVVNRCYRLRPRMCMGCRPRANCYSRAFDDPHTFDNFPELLSAFTQYRMSHTAQVSLPICLTMCKMWSATSMYKTSSSHAAVRSIAFAPLYLKQKFDIVNHTYTGLRAGRNQTPQQSSTEIELLHNITAVPSNAWPKIGISNSAVLPAVHFGHEDSQLLLQLVDRPSTIAQLMVIIIQEVGKPAAESLAYWLNSKRHEIPNFKCRVMTRLREALAKEINWANIIGGHPPLTVEQKQQLLRAFVTRAISGKLVRIDFPVEHDNAILKPFMRWEQAQMYNLVSLHAQGVQQLKADQEVQSVFEARLMTNTWWSCEMHVHMPPATLLVLGTDLNIPEVADIKRFLQPINHMVKEVDVSAIIALRAWLTGRLTWKECAAMGEVVCGTRLYLYENAHLKSHRCAQSTLTAMPILHKEVMLLKDLPLEPINEKQVDFTGFMKHIREFEATPGMGFAWYGSDNQKSNVAWVLLRQPRTDKAFVVIVISDRGLLKKKIESGTQGNENNGVEKDSWVEEFMESGANPYMCIHLTDEWVAKGNLHYDNVVPVGAVRHDVLFGSACALVRVLLDM